MLFEDELLIWHRLDSELQQAKEQLQTSVTTQAPPLLTKQLQQQVESLQQQAAASMQKVQKQLDADRARARYWSSAARSA